MKKIAVFFLIFAWILSIMNSYRLIKNEKNFYPLTTIVVKVDDVSHIVTCKDFNGNLWEFENCEDWNENDIASLLMDSKGTENIYDDEIIKAEYNGWVN